MNHLNLRGRYFLLLIILVAGCTFPFTTASYKWNIKYDKKKLAFKENFLKQELPPYSGNKLPNILFIVIDDVGKSEISRPSRWRSIRINRGFDWQIGNQRLPDDRVYDGIDLIPYVTGKNHE